jgi:hypothetical protein
MTQPIKPRRWFRYSLRMLVVVVMGLCVWLGFMVNAARRPALEFEDGCRLFDHQIGRTHRPIGQHLKWNQI